MKDKLVILFSNYSSGLNFSKIKKKLDTSCEYTDEELKRILCELELEGLIYCDNKDVYHKFPSNFFIAEIQITTKGNPYIIYNNQQHFLNWDNLPGILGFETVIFEKNDDSFQLIKILNRKIKQVVCEVKIDEMGKKHVKVSNSKNNVPISLSFPPKDKNKEQSKKQKHEEKMKQTLVDGDRILVNLTNELYDNGLIGLFIKKIGHKNDLDDELEAIAINNGFEINYGKKIEKELENMPTQVEDKDLINRVDKRKDRVFTIDGPYTKDIDDAIEIKMLENGNFLLTVSIAHVSHYIKPNMALWKFAETNTTSVYLIDSVLAMLPHQISNGICSLNPNVDRLARSFEMEIDLDGNIVDFKTYKSVVHSMKRMSYPEVNKILEEQIVPDGYEEFVSDLILMNQLSHILTKKRTNNGAVDFNNKELEFHNIDGNIENHTSSQGEAKKLIENFMVTTNVAVGNYFYNMFFPFVYRNHETSFINKIEASCELLKNLNYTLDKIHSLDDPKIIQKIIASLADKEEFIVLSSIILKSMQRAYYSNNNQGHYGLAVNCYSQSTSPIRRFLDLVIHTLIDYYEDLHNDLNQKLDDYLEKVCAHASFKERCADKAEFEANQLYMIYYMQDKIGEEFVGYISDINSRYISIKTEDLIDGICYYELTNTQAFYSPQHKTIFSKENVPLLKVGNKVSLRLNGVNLKERQIFFEILDLSLNDPIKLVREKIV